MRYLFPKTLQKGIIRDRPNRFVMLVESRGEFRRCRCPSPTKIGNINFKAIPCLLSTNGNQSKTSHTVEAIAVKDATGKRCWIGINQTKANAICKYFIDKKRLPKLIKGTKPDRGGKVKDSIIDFVSKDILLEIKTPLTVLPDINSKLTNYTHTGEYERTIRHCRVLTKHAESGKRAILLLAYLYPAPLFNPLKQNSTNKTFVKVVQHAYKKGVEFWQINFLFNNTGVSLLKYSKLRFHNPVVAKRCN